ncbi:alpha/beta fold hydrolase [Aeromicrobium duanguangcaii]|uniref:Alpha/beta fold hydrolase n=1 Tax=Aeromicrobium duanguangcaii TaxID=2968086 RepID=A0ABY5KD42_9ACTN|nr:alpha/beta fold hydrolase [Aeromicrobium duanguangcaii]MCD9154871.1 alpha/beta fold hydrolase [Aeromicrobium duanguangcaii]UUI67719.1 alpha/beta fold hydrolase [Aeromicrobium duanguangcaii]
MRTDRASGRGAAVLVAAATLAGVVAIARPLSAVDALLVVTVVGLAVAGLHELVTTRSARDRLIGALLVAAAVVLAVRPVWGVRALVTALGVVLIGEGLLAVHRRRSWWDAAWGTGLVLLGLLALAWPDISVFVLGVLLGVRLVLVGFPGLARALPRPVAATLVLVTALALCGYTVVITSTSPEPGRFYTAPADTPRSPGLLLRAEPFTTDVPTGARAWRILYSTTRAGDEPTIASAVVAVPDDQLMSRTPVIAWAHGTTGLESRCAPSLRQRNTVGAGGIAAVHAALDRGWAVVAPDYPGLGTGGVQPYLIGSGEARSVLDAVRAARRIPQLNLGRRTVVWGHSQGGHAALWTAMTQPDYAPDVALSGVAAVSPVSNPTTFLRDLQRRPVGTIFVAYALAAYEATYDDVDVDDHVRASAQLPIDRIASRCLRSKASRVSLTQAQVMADRFVAGSLYDGALARRLSENDATGAITSPLLIAQGERDRVVTLRLQDDYVRDRCAAGQSLDYRTYAGRGHGDLLREESPFVDELLDWTADRFSSKPTTTTC